MEAFNLILLNLKYQHAYELLSRLSAYYDLVITLTSYFCLACQLDDPFEHAGSILVNISKNEAGRKLLLDPKRGLLKQIVRQFDSTNPLRKKGVCEILSKELVYSVSFQPYLVLSFLL